LTGRVFIEDADGIRRLEPAEFPLSLGGPDPDIDLVGAPTDRPVAWIGLSDDEVFVQADNGGGDVVCNGAAVATSQWLRPGDELRVGGTRIHVEAADDGTRLRVEHDRLVATTEPPKIVGETVPSSTAGGGADATIRPVAFRPRPIRGDRTPRRRRFVAAGLVWLALGLVGVNVWLLLTVRTVEIVVQPPPDRVELSGGLFAFEVDGRYVVRPGRYTVIAEKEGYGPLEIPIEVTADGERLFRFDLRKLPGRLAVRSGAVAGAEVLIDDEPVGSTPLDGLPLAPGDYSLRVRASRYQDHVAPLRIEGGGVTQALDIELVPRWSVVAFRSSPTGAVVRVDGDSRGTAPITLDLMPGSYRVELELEGYKPYRRRLEVGVNEPQTLPAVALELLDAGLMLDSAPARASVTVDGVYQGQTPLHLHLSPGETHVLTLSKAGHDSATREVRIASGETDELRIALTPREGDVRVTAEPAGALLYVDGEPRGAADQTLSLVAVPHEIEVRKEGFVSFRTTVTPRPGFVQSIEATLQTAEEIREAAIADRIRSTQGQEMVLIRGGRFRMGASRREPGRRANETLRDVELTRDYYLATTEVTNRQFREFESDHLSGQAGAHNLEIDHHPAVRVTWEQAALFCNWLSKQESLPPAYVRVNGRLVLARPPTTGYRLPTEAEWAWAARFPGGGDSLKYPWGDTLPVPPESGNYADASTAGLLSGSLPDYQDGFPATAPAESFAPNALGLFNMGGNVAEWVSDIYTIHPSGSGRVDVDPLGPVEGDLHVIRGSSWMDSSVSELRLTFRDYGKEPRADLGFRIARYAE
jgi:formylglycine-generating enzyme required for sulfatase activity